MQNVYKNIEKCSTLGICFTQGILAAVLSAVLGTRDPDQVATMAKQAGEVCSYIIVHILFLFIILNLLEIICINIHAVK